MKECQCISKSEQTKDADNGWLRIVEIQRILILRISLAWLNLDLKSSIHVSMTMTMYHHDIMVMSCVVWSMTVTASASLLVTVLQLTHRCIIVSLVDCESPCSRFWQYCPYQCTMYNVQCTMYIGVKIEELCYWQRMTSLRQLTLSLVPSCYLCECLGRTGPATWKWQLYSSVRWAQPMAPQPIWGPDRSALQSWHQYTYTGGLSTKLGRLCAKIFIDIQFKRDLYEPNKAFVHWGQEPYY